MLALAVPLVATVAGVDRAGTSEENREPAPMPPAPRDYASLMTWADGFTRYFADGFAFRSRLVRWQARFRVQVLHSSTTPDVILGRNDWLFYATDGATADYTSADPFSAEDLETWRTTLQHTQDWLEARGVTYLFVITPDKHVIYPDQMPSGIHRIGRRRRADELMTYLRTHSTVRAVDVTSALVRASAGARLFHHTDTHWNDLGALAGYQQVMANLGARVSPARTRADFEVQGATTYGFDLARMLGLASVLAEQDLRLEPRLPRRARIVEPAPARRDLMEGRVVTERPGTLPRALVFRDSFGSAMIPFLSEHFSRAVYLWQNDVDPAEVIAEHPDVVIQQWVGRHLHTAMPYDAVAALSESRQQ